jgi:hypothetical protein
VVFCAEFSVILGGVEGEFFLVSRTVQLSSEFAKENRAGRRSILSVEQTLNYGGISVFVLSLIFRWY